MKVPVVKESTALGAAICAGVGVGLFSNIQDTSESLVQWEKIFEPNSMNHVQYQKLYKQWRETYDRCLRMVDDGLVTPMWRAAGT